MTSPSSSSDASSRGHRALEADQLRLADGIVHHQLACETTAAEDVAANTAVMAPPYDREGHFALHALGTLHHALLSCARMDHGEWVLLPLHQEAIDTGRPSHLLLRHVFGSGSGTRSAILPHSQHRSPSPSARPRQARLLASSPLHLDVSVDALIHSTALQHLPMKQRRSDQQGIAWLYS